MGEYKSRWKKKKKFFGIQVTPFNAVLFLISIFLIVLIGARMAVSERQLISISAIALISGLLIEARRIAKNWQEVIFNVLLAFGLSVASFLPGRREGVYDFEAHIAHWPYIFLVVFAIISIAIHEKRITRKLDEGVTLIHATAILYWILDSGILFGSNGFYFATGCLGLLFVAYAAFHALTYTDLTNKHRYRLSVGSSIIMIIFAANYAYNIFQSGSPEKLSNFGDIAYVLMQYFLLGISSVYMIHNAYMIFEFIPEKHHLFDAEYFRNIKELKKKHVDRYSESQLKISVALLFFFASGLIFWLNYQYQLVPRHTVIWILFVTLPVFGYFSKPLKEDKKRRKCK